MVTPSHIFVKVFWSEPTQNILEPLYSPSASRIPWEELEYVAGEKKTTFNYCHHEPDLSRMCKMDLFFIMCWSYTSSHFPLRRSSKNTSSCITLKRAVPQHVRLNYKGCHFQTRFTQSKDILMINLLYPTHTHIMLEWKIPMCVQMCIFVEFHLRLNSLLTAIGFLYLFHYMTAKEHQTLHFLSIKFLKED